MVPTDADTDFAALRVPRLKTEIARSEIKFLVVKRIIRNVHLAILAQYFSVGIDDGRGGGRAARLET